MRAGQLRHRLHFEENVPAKSSSGAEAEAWLPRFVDWASIEPIRGREFYSRDQVRDDIDVRIRVRWSRQTDAVTPKWRARKGSTIYNLRSVAHIDLREREIEMMASTGLNEG